MCGVLLCFYGLIIREYVIFELDAYDHVFFSVEILFLQLVRGRLIVAKVFLRSFSFMREQMFCHILDIGCTMPSGEIDCKRPKLIVTVGVTGVCRVHLGKSP